MYYFFVDDLLLPITPSAVTINYKNQNKNYVLINDSEITVLKDGKLPDIAFDFLIPHQQYAFAADKTGFKGQQTYIDKLKDLKARKKPFQFIIVRFKGNRISFHTNLKVSLEDYSLKESADNGFDVIASVKLKEYKDYGTKIMTADANNKVANLTKSRSDVTSPKPTSSTEYKVKSGDTLWAIAKKFYGDGSKYKVIAEKNNIKNPNLIYPEQKIILPKIS